jgi:hypothetical protein
MQVMDSLNATYGNTKSALLHKVLDETETEKRKTFSFLYYRLKDILEVKATE